MKQPFNFEQCITDYRKAIDQRNAESTKAAKSKFSPELQKLRDAWREWQGEDSLHEATFGQPECE